MFPSLQEEAPRVSCHLDLEFDQYSVQPLKVSEKFRGKESAHEDPPAYQILL